jgi:Ca-activated chloride channel family protein
MTLDSPGLLVVGLLVAAALVVGAVVLGRRRSAALAAAGAAPPRGGRQLGLWFTLAGVVVLAVAVAGPAASVPVPRASGTVVLAMDVSNSMSADDVRPTRLAAAQKAARKFIAAQPGTVDIGVVAFEDGALVTAKPNADHSVAEAAVNRLAVTGGTSIGSAILSALGTITGKSVAVGPNGQIPDLGYWPNATIVLFSDGEDQGEGADPQAAAQVAQKAGVHIDTVGVGTAGGATVEADGLKLHTALHEDTLKLIAQTSGGTYHPATDAGQLGDVASQIDLRLTVARQQLPLAGAFTGLALALLAVGALLTVARNGRVV